MAAKGGCFCKGYNEVVSFETEQIGMKFGKKRQSVSSIEEF